MTRPREALAATITAVGLALALLGGHALHGGFALDDWTNAARYRFAGGFFHALSALYIHSPSSKHPGQAVVYAASFGLFGGDGGGHLWALAVVCGLVSAALYIVIRLAGLGPLAAAAPALLVLVWPYADASKLWLAAGANEVALLFALLGATVALQTVPGTCVAGDSPANRNDHELRKSGFAGTSRATHVPGTWRVVSRMSRERRLVGTVVSLGLYAAAVLTYELLAGAIVFSGLLYVAVAGRREAVRRWLADLVVVVLCVAFVRHHDPVAAAQPLSGTLDHARTIADQSLTVLARTLEPFGTPDRWPVLIVALLVCALAWPLRCRPARRLLAAGVVLVVAGYLLIAPAPDFYLPLAPGQDNRTNLLAQLGFALIAAGVLASLGMLASWTLNRRRSRAMRRRPAYAAVFAAGTLVLAIGLGHRLRDDAHAWDRGHADAVHLLAVVHRAVPHPAPHTTIYLLGQPAEVASGVPVLEWIWDLSGAVKTLYGDPTLSGLPSRPGLVWICASDRVYPTLGTQLGPYYGAPYGSAVLVTPSGRTTRVGSAAECRTELPRFGAAVAPATS